VGYVPGSGGLPVFYKSPGLAAVLSFLYAGLGQIYNGEIVKGVVFIIVYSVSLLLCFVLIGFILAPLVWLEGIIDAYRSAQRINLRLWRDSQRRQDRGE